MVRSAAMRILVLIFALGACSHDEAGPAKTPTVPAPSSAATGCPAPSKTTDICAAVMTYAKAPDGSCCSYASPCNVPFDGPRFSDDACATPMGPTTTPQ
jgi:hypothetical protein